MDDAYRERDVDGSVLQWERVAVVEPVLDPGLATAARSSTPSKMSTPMTARKLSTR